MRTLGTICGEMGDTVKAEEILREVVKSSQQTLGKEHSETLFALAVYGQMRHTMGNLEEGLSMATEAYDGLLERYGPDYGYTVSVRSMVESLHALQRQQDMLTPQRFEERLLNRKETPDDDFISLCLAQGFHPGDRAADGTCKRDPATVKLLAQNLLAQVQGMRDAHGGAAASRAKVNRTSRARVMQGVQQSSLLVRAVVVGLHSRPELNGSQAEVVTFLPDKVRYKCTV
jgi:hypothetical protein